MNNQVFSVSPDPVIEGGRETNRSAAENMSALGKFNQALDAVTTGIVYSWPSVVSLLDGYKSTFAAAYQAVILHQTEIGDGLMGVASLTVQTDQQVANQVHGLSAEMADLQGAIANQGNLSTDLGGRDPRVKINWLRSDLQSLEGGGLLQP